MQPGVAPRRLLTPETGIVRTYREEDALYIDRTKVDLGQCDNVYAIVYTSGAWNRDPEVSEAEKVAAEGYKHVLVTTLGNRGPVPPVSPHRFMHNVAGGNARWSLFFGTDIQKKAEEFVARSADEPIDTPIEESWAWYLCEWVTEIPSTLPDHWRRSAAIREIEDEQAERRPDPFISVAEKIFSSRRALVETATTSRSYWKDWALVA